VVAEEGMHDELVQRGGVYAKLYRIKSEEGPSVVAARAGSTVGI